MASITLRQIDFADGDLCRPRYPIFYRYPKLAAPTQLEPAFQIDDALDELSVELNLSPGAKVEFIDDGGKPLCRELNRGDDFKPKVEYIGEEKTSCVLTWERWPEGPITRVFRLYCKPQNAPEDELTKEQKVHGGLFLAFITHPTGQMGKEIPPTKFPGLRPGSVWLLGSDPSHCPLYDHFHPLTPPPGVEFEPAFRTRAGRSLEFGMVQGIHLAAWWPELKFLQPEVKPDDLSPTHTSTYYSFDWQTSAPSCPGAKACEKATVVTFHLRPSLPAPNGDLKNRLVEAGWTEGWEAYREVVEGIGVDPTIIQPPPCDPHFGVCYQDPPSWPPGAPTGPAVPPEPEPGPASA